MFQSGLFYYSEYWNEKFFVAPQTVHIECQMYDYLGEVVETQTYINPTNASNLCYQFPLDENSAIQKFTAKFGNEEIEGVCKKRDVAQREFDKTKHQAVLLKQNQENVFVVQLGNLKQGETCSVTVHYLTLFDQQGKYIRANFPLRYAPRYVPEHAFQQLQVMDMQPNVEAPKECVFRMHVHSVNKIREASSPSHSIVTTTTADGTVSQLTMETKMLDKDLCLLLEPEDPYVSRVVFEKSEEDGVMAMISCVSPAVSALDMLDNAAEVVVLMDCSASMNGKPIQWGKHALKVFLRSLPQHCVFNIGTFGVRDKFLWQTSRPVCEESNVAEALEFVSEMSADQNGTKILPPLKQLLENYKPVRVEDKTLPRSIVVVTDGRVFNVDEVVECCKQLSTQTYSRICTLGVGEEVDRSLVKRMSRAGCGTYEFVQDVKTLPSTVVRLLTNALTPALTNVQMKWPEQLAAVTIPTILPGMNNGHRYVAFAKMKELPQTTGELQLVANQLFSSVMEEKEAIRSGITNQVLTRVPFDPKRCLTSTSFIHCFATREQIRELEEHAPTRKQLQLEIETLALKYNLMSSQTSFLAIRKSSEEPLGWFERPYVTSTPDLAYSTMLCSSQFACSSVPCSVRLTKSDNVPFTDDEQLFQLLIKQQNNSSGGVVFSNVLLMIARHYKVRFLQLENTEMWEKTLLEQSLSKEAFATALFLHLLYGPMSAFMGESRFLIAKAEKYLIRCSSLDLVQKFQ